MEEDIDHKEDNMEDVNKVDKEYSDNKVDFALEEDNIMDLEEQNMEDKFDFDYKLVVFVEFEEFVDLIQLVYSMLDS